MTAADTATPLVPPVGEIAELVAIDRPTRRDEAWRYAPHRDLAQLTFGPSPSAPPELPAEVAAQIPEVGGPRIVIIDGALDRSGLDARVDGLRAWSLADAAEQHPDLLRAHLDRGAEGVADAFDALNVAYGVDGAAIEVAAGTHIEAPIQLVSVATPGNDGAATCGATVVHLGAGSSATLVETHLGGSSSVGGSNTRTTITLEEGATLDHVVLQDVTSSHVLLLRIAVTQAAGSTYRTSSFNLGARYGRLDYRVHLDGPDATAELSGLYVGNGDQTLDQQITIVHAAPDCTSRQTFRGVLDDESTGVFNGGIDVRPGAIGTDAEQSNANLLLSKRAEANTQPRLEILADDVACKHGATVGQLDEGALYYLRSRGIPGDDARRLLIGGFAGQIVDGVEIDAVREWLAERVGVTGG